MLICIYVCVCVFMIFKNLAGQEDTDPPRGRQFLEIAKNSLGKHDFHKQTNYFESIPQTFPFI